MRRVHKKREEIVGARERGFLRVTRVMRVMAPGGEVAAHVQVQTTKQRPRLQLSHAGHHRHRVQSLRGYTVMHYLPRGDSGNVSMICSSHELRMGHELRSPKYEFFQTLAKLFHPPLHIHPCR